MKCVGRFYEGNINLKKKNHIFSNALKRFMPSSGKIISANKNSDEFVGKKI